jgi:hypothetical protein
MNKNLLIIGGILIAASIGYYIYKSRNRELSQIDVMNDDLLDL